MMIAPCRQLNPGKSRTHCGCVSNRSCRSAIRVRGQDASTGVGLAAGVNRLRRAKSSPPLSMCSAPVANGRRCPRASAAPARFTITFNSGGRRASFCDCGERGWLNTTTWRGLPGNGKVWTGRKARRPWRKRPSETTRRIGGKKGTKRSLLVDGRGAPLSLIVAGANRHDVKLLAQTLDAIVVPRPKPTKRRRQNLCVDKG